MQPCALMVRHIYVQTFDEMLLLKRGGSVIYNGPLGEQSGAMIAYFESIPGVQPIAKGYSAPHILYAGSQLLSGWHCTANMPTGARSLHRQQDMISSRARVMTQRTLRIHVPSLARRTVYHRQ